MGIDDLFKDIEAHSLANLVSPIGNEIIYSQVSNRFVTGETYDQEI